MTRPISITVIGWVIIAVSIEGLIGILGGLATPLLTSGAIHASYPLSTTLWLGGIALVVNLLLAALILSGFGWARVVFVALLVVSIVGIVASRQPLSVLLLTGTKLVVFSYFLCRREANRYFAESAAADMPKDR